MDAVNTLGYAPNFVARALAAKRTNTFGAIIPTMENAIFARGLQAFQEELGHYGVTTLVASSSYQTDLEEAQIRALVARGADALLLIGHDRTPESYDFLTQRRIPFVVAWAYNPAAPHLCIGFNNRQSMKSLADQVIAHGHRTLGYITAERGGNDRARERFEGACDAMVAHNMDPARLSVVETSYSIDNGQTAFAQLMEADPRPTAVLCGNDVLAVGAILMARKMGLRVPEDVSVTGYDDIEISEIVSPQLTTVHVPHREMGRRAAQMLLAIRAGEGPVSSVELGATVKWRESLGVAAPEGNSS